MQKQELKSKQSLVQDQAYTYGVMGNLFSSLECYAHRSNGNCQMPYYFEFYNNFNSGQLKDKEQLLDQIITQIEIFKFSYLIFIQSHGEYFFPKSFSQEHIINCLNEWKKYVAPNDVKYYDAVISIIKTKNEKISFVDELNQKVINNGGKPGTINPQFLANEGTRIIEYSNQVGAKAIHNLKDNPDYQPDIILGAQKENNPYLDETQKRMQKRNKLQNFLDNLFCLFCLYIEELSTLYHLDGIRYYYYDQNGFNEDDQQLYQLLLDIVNQIKEQYGLFKQLCSVYVVQNDQGTVECLEAYFSILHITYQSINKNEIAKLLEEVRSILKENSQSLTSTSMA